MINNYYQKNKEKLQKEAPERYQNLSEEEKNKKRQYVRERYRNLSEEEKEKKRQYDGERYKSLLEDEYNTTYFNINLLNAETNINISEFYDICHPISLLLISFNQQD